MSDRETLLGAGFDPARVDCECYTYRVPQFPGFLIVLGISLCRGAEDDGSPRDVARDGPPHRERRQSRAPDPSQCHLPQRQHGQREGEIQRMKMKSSRR
jgi:hypothetical protein